MNTSLSTPTFSDYRRKAGFTQESLARASGCSVAYVRILDKGWAPDPEKSPKFRRVVEVLRTALDPEEAA